MAEDALAWLDAHMLEAIDAPDEAFDWIYMLPSDNWPKLLSLWKKRDPDWREACAYVMAEGPAKECVMFLGSAIFDVDLDVRQQAVESLRHQLSNHPELWSLIEAEERAELERLDPSRE